MNKKRKWQPRELAMGREYVNKFYANRIAIPRVRLGTIEIAPEIQAASTQEIRMMGIFRRWCDWIILGPPDNVILEIAIRPDPGDISKLQCYKLLWPKTQEFTNYMHHPTRMELCYAITDPVVIHMAKTRHIKCVKFEPSFLPEYLKILMPRERTPPKSGGIL
mgnify:CR=1 FL=1